MANRDIAARPSSGAAVKFKFDPARYHALSIGINTYQDKALDNLRTAQGDAEFLSATLIQHCGFQKSNVRTLVNSAETCWNGIDAALRGYINQLDDDDALLIYFAGHGIADSQTGDGYWIPSDGKRGQPNTYFNHTNVQSIVKTIRARHVALISDSCFAGRLLRLVDDATPAHADEPTWCHDAWNKRSRTILTSGDDHPVSDEGSAGHSIFNLRLTDYLRAGPETVFGLSDIAASIRRRVQGQRVCYGPMRDEAHDNGEFVFCRVTAQKPRQPVAPPIPEIDPATIEVTEYKVDPIEIEVEIVNVSEPTSLPADLPPVPKEYFELQAKITGIDRTLKRLEDNSHPSLDAARQAVQDAQSQHERLLAEYIQIIGEHSDLSKQMTATLRDRPQATASELLDLKPQEMSRSDFAHCVVWVRKVLEAKQVHQSVQKELSHRRTQEIKHLRRIRDGHHSEVVSLQTNLLHEATLSFLKKHGLLKKEGPFPEEQLLDLVPRLAEYPFDISEDKMWEYAETAFQGHFKKKREQRRKRYEEKRRQREDVRQRQREEEQRLREELQKKQEERREDQGTGSSSEDDAFLLTPTLELDEDSSDASDSEVIDLGFLLGEGEPQQEEEVQEKQETSAFEAAGGFSFWVMIGMTIYGGVIDGFAGALWAFGGALVGAMGGTICGVLAGGCFHFFLSFISEFIAKVIYFAIAICIAIIGTVYGALYMLS